MTRWKKICENDAGFVEVLTSRASGERIGYRLIGAKAGPQLVAAGVCEAAEHVFDRFLSIPTLPWMRGNLILLRLDVLHDVIDDLEELRPMGRIDQTVLLAWDDGEITSDTMVRRNYHMVLRACTNHGMISGRGVAKENTEVGSL